MTRGMRNGYDGKEMRKRKLTFGSQMRRAPPGTRQRATSERRARAATERPRRCILLKRRKRLAKQ